MICPDCGTENPDGTAFCVNCSATLGGGGGFRLASPGGTSGSGLHESGSSPFSSTSYSDNTGGSVNDALFGGQNSSYNNVYGADSLVPAKKKSASTNWIPFVIAIAVIVVLVIGAGYSVLGWKYNGTYELTKISVSQGDVDYTFETEELEALTGSKINITLKISYGRGTLSVDSDAAALGVKNYRGRVRFKGNRVIFDGESGPEGVYNSKDKTITVDISQGGLTGEMVFKKK